MPAALKGDSLRAAAQELPDWEVIDDHHIHKAFAFPDFVKALDFVNRVGAIAEQQGHHPDILFTWGKAEITVYTHSVDGLTEKDFTLAQAINTLN